MLPTDQEEIFKLVDTCSKSNVEGYDFISNQILSLAAPVLAQPVTYSTTRCLSECVFRNIFKTAKVLPVYKSGDVDAVQNYRPLAILSSLGNVIEKNSFT